MAAFAGQLRFISRMTGAGWNPVHRPFSRLFEACWRGAPACPYPRMQSCCHSSGDRCAIADRAGIDFQHGLSRWTMPEWNSCYRHHCAGGVGVDARQCPLSIAAAISVVPSSKPAICLPDGHYRMPSRRANPGIGAGTTRKWHSAASRHRAMVGVAGVHEFTELGWTAITSRPGHNPI